MAIILSKIDGYTPVCGECGIVLCYDISETEYQDKKEFWDNWQCDICNPQIKGSWLKLEISKHQSSNSIIPLKARGITRCR